MICPSVQIEARLSHKFNALKKHAAIVEDLKKEIKILETEKHFVYFHLMSARKSY